MSTAPDRDTLAALARDARWHVTEDEKWSRFKLGSRFDLGPAITVWWDPDGSARAATLTDGDGEPMAEASMDVAGWVRGRISPDITEGPAMSSDHDQFAAIEAMRARIADLEVERDRARRGGQTLGATVDRQCRAVLDATGLHHLIDESGDGDWGLVWERLAEMGAGWRPPAQVIETPEDLEALRAGTVVIELDNSTDTTACPTIWYRAGDESGLFWEEPGGTGEWDASHINLPVRVLHTPAETGGGQ